MHLRQMLLGAVLFLAGCATFQTAPDRPGESRCEAQARQDYDRCTMGSHDSSMGSSGGGSGSGGWGAESSDVECKRRMDMDLSSCGAR